MLCFTGVFIFVCLQLLAEYRRGVVDFKMRGNKNSLLRDELILALALLFRLFLVIDTIEVTKKDTFATPY